MIKCSSQTEDKHEIFSTTKKKKKFPLDCRPKYKWQNEKASEGKTVEYIHEIYWENEKTKAVIYICSINKEKGTHI